MMAGLDRVRAQALLDGLEQQHLKLAAVDRELRPVVTSLDAARLAPDLLTVFIEIEKLLGLDGDLAKRVLQAELGQLATGMRQNIDADTERPDLVHTFKDPAFQAGGMQAQGKRQPANSTADNSDPHIFSPQRAFPPKSLKSSA